MSLHWPIIASLIRQPRRVVVTDDRRTYKGAEVLVAALHVAAAVGAKCQSETVGLLLPTSGAFPIAALAGWMLGKTVVPINYLLKPEEMNYVIRDCGCDTVVTVQPMLDFLGASADECLYAKGGGGGGAPTAVKHLIRLEDIAFRGLPDIGWPRLIEESRLAVLLYTSGTSGKPKGVMLTHANIAANIRQITNWVDFDPRRDKMFGVLPQFHSFGLTVLSMLPLTCRIPVVYTARFVPHKIIQSLREHRPTIMVAIPSMYNALLHAKDVTGEDFASLRYIVSGGEPLPQVVFEAYRERFGVTINEGYGLTETAPVTNWCRPHEARRGSVGRALPELEQRIVDIESGRVLGPDQDGEVRMRGPNVMRGYYHLPEESAKAFDNEGFFRTGDIGRLDGEGHLFITGRLKEMLIIGGENVFPREIEEVLNAHPSVKESGVVGKKDPIRGELPVAFVELREGATFDPKSIIMHCRGKLAGYKIPDEIRQLEALPRNPTGKVMRRELKKMVGETVFAG
ncbi:MAG: AMP-binding protein [Phycisphaerales bacterium]|nr:AMP-binding protein [Phycisphaerales bacterium]